jgi:hypothetical protein
MKCLETQDCWCAACTDRAIAADQAAAIVQPFFAKASGWSLPVDIAWIFENGLEQKLSASVRCF